MVPVTGERQVNGQGVLEFSLLLGAAEAGRTVKVIVEDAVSRSPMTHEEWQERVESLAGSWQGELERQPPGEYEMRSPIS